MSPRRVARAPSGSFSFAIPPPVAQPLPRTPKPDNSPPLFTYQVPTSLGLEPAAEPPHRKGKEKDTVEEHERPLTTQERVEVDNLNSVQIRNLAERFRDEFAEEARPGHRAELYRELQTNFDRELAAALEAKDKEIAGLQGRLSSQQQGHYEAMQVIVRYNEHLRQELDQHRNHSDAEKVRAESELTRAAEESRRLEEAIAGLEREKEASKASGGQSKEEERLEASLRRAEEEVEEVKTEKKAAEARTRSLLFANMGLEREKDELKRKSSSAKSALGRANAERNRWMMEVEDLTTDLPDIERRIAVCEARLEEERREKADLAADLAAAKEAAKRAVKGEREMDSPLGAPKRANEGSLRPQSPSWREFVFWLVVSLLLGWLVVKTSPSNHGLGSAPWGEDPWLDLSRGMYGVREGVGERVVEGVGDIYI